MKPRFSGALAALIAMLLLCSCYPEPGDLRKELRDLIENERSKVQPLPALWTTPRSSYEAGKLPDPFYPDIQP